MEEFEVKFLEVNVPELERKLLTIGAEKIGDYEKIMSEVDELLKGDIPEFFKIIIRV